MNEPKDGARVLNFALTGTFLAFLKNLAGEGRAGDFWRSRGIGRADIRLGSPGSRPAGLRELTDGLPALLAAAAEARIRLTGVPFCLLGENLLRNEYLLENSDDSGRFKAPFCAGCSYAGRCAGFPEDYRAEILAGPCRAIPDKPIEVMVEAEARCSYSCSYCFNRNTFAPGRGAGVAALPQLSAAAIKDIIRQLAAWDVPRMRFTGGEPLLRDDLPELLSAARESGVRAWINTNGHGLGDAERAGELCAFTDNVLVSLRGWDAASDASESGVKDSFEQSCGAARALRAAGLRTLRLGICATGRLIRNLDTLGEVLKGLSPDRVEFYRPVPSAGGKEEASRGELRALTDKLLAWRSAGELNAYIANPLPFCFYDEDKVSRVALGAVLGEGNARFAVDPRGFCKPAYYMDVNLGDCGDLQAAWATPFSRSVRALEFLPESCAGCFYAGKCRGGSRHAARLASGDWRAPDPLSRAAAEL